MLIAMNQKQELIEADVTLSRTENYHCPSCKQAVHLKRGAVMRPHFAHYQKEACDVFSEGETEEHIQGKIQIKAWLEAQNIPVEMEAYLPSLKQRPDLLITINQQKIALEFQCSAIPIHKIVERTHGYMNAGIQVIWILGEQFRYTKKLTALHKACLTLYQNQLVLFHYSTTKKQLEYRYNFQLQQNQKMRQTRKILRTGNKIRLQFDKPRPLHTKINDELEHSKLLRQLQFPSTKTKRFLQNLYENGETLISMPKEIHTCVANEWLVQSHSYEWKMQFIWWFEQLPVQTVLTNNMLTEWADQLDYYEIPQMTPTQKLQPLKEFIDVLTDRSVLKQIRIDKWSIKTYPKRYKRLEEKLK